MARSRSKKKSGKPAKKSRKSKKADVSVDEVEVVEESKSLGIDDGMVIVTTLILIAAFVFTDYLLGVDYAKGWFFADKFGG
jgi:hypothetical protein